MSHYKPLFYIRYAFPWVLLCQIIAEHARWAFQKTQNVSTCDHSHVDTCDRCFRLASVVNEIEDALKEAECTNDTREELVFVTSQAKQHIHSWKSHLLRSTHQDDCRLDVIKDLDETSVLLVLDWAMKYLPRKFRESQTDWYGKRGIPWHIAVAMRRETGGEMEMMSFVYLFESCNQDSCAVLVILNGIFGQPKGIMPQLKSVYLRQDNAGYKWIYESSYIWNAENDIKICLIIAVIHSTKAVEKLKPEKKIQAWTGFELTTSAIPVQCSTNWAIKPTGSWSFCEFVIYP